MKGFYSPIDQLAAQLPRTKGTGAEFMTELSKRPGYKPQEAQDRELQTLMALPKMERAKFLEALKAKPAPQLNETVLTDNDNTYDDDNIAKYGEYTLPGGNNYREILLRMPYNEQRAKEFSDPASGHWDHANVLAHVRAKDRKGPNGEKILHIEEIQSDWHQKGRERGYATPEGLQQFKAAELAHRRLKEQLEEAKGHSANIDKKLGSDTLLYQDPAVRQRMEAAKIEQNNRIMDLMPQVMNAQAKAQDLGHKLNNVVPNAPFKKNWHELALKKMIHHAAANGYDSIAITPGQEQAKRYDLSKHINAIEYERSDDGNRYTLSAIGPHGNRVHDESGIPISRVEELVGKEMANKIENNVGKVNNENYLVKTKNGDVVFETKSIRDAKEFARVHPETTDVISSNDPSNKNGLRTLSGLDLQVGGEGMKGFYDKMIPSFLNQFGKKYGAQVQPGSVSIVSTPAQHHGLTESQFQAQSPDEQQRMVRQHAYAHQGAKTEVPVHHFPITPQMREDVTQNGVPLYAKGGEVEVRPTVKDETIQRKIPEIEAAAKALQAGAINRKEYDKVVHTHKPVKPYTFVPQPASDEDADRALMANKKPHWRGHEQWPAGRKVGLRLDIPAYETHGVWVNSIHDEEGKGEDKRKTSYGPVSSVKNATFDAGPSKAIKVATGEDNKSPFARIHGELHHMTEDEAVEHMKAHLNHPDYAQVGMDPRRHGFFYDRKTMKPVTASAHVVQIGPLVLAHKPTYGKRESYATGGKVKPIGYTKEKVTVSPNLDQMRYELMSVKHSVKKVK